MNAFYMHHQNSIAMHYACFDRMVVDVRISAFLRPERALGFFSQDRGLFPVQKNDLVKICSDYEKWVREEIQSRGCPLLEAPEGDAMSSGNPTSPPPNRTRSWASSKRENRYGS